MAYFPVVIFWILDAYYLGIEKRFARLYDDVRQKREEEIDYSMDGLVIR